MHLRKQYTFASFPDAIAYVNRLAPKAEAADHHPDILSVSNSSSGRRWKLDHAPAVGDPTHMVEFGTGRRAFAREA